MWHFDISELSPILVFFPIIVFGPITQFFPIITGPIILQPFLKKLVNSHPQLYPARIWLAQALANVDPHLSLEQLEEAVKLSPTGSKPFRIAINLALRNKMGEELDEWCSRYKNAHFGAFQPKSSSTLSTDGIGLRRVTLEVLSDSGDRLFITNMGLQLDKSKTYYFSLTKSTLAKELRVHLAIVSGISVDLKKIRTYKSGELKNSFDAPLPQDSSGKSKSYNTKYTFDNGDIIFIACYDWSEETGKGDHFRYGILSNEFAKWVRGAHK